MDAKRSRYGFALAAVGASALVASLWLPWFRFHLSAQGARQLEAISGPAGARDPFLRFVHAGRSLPFTGWQLIGSSRIVIVLVGALIVGLAVAGIAGASRTGVVGAVRAVSGKAIALFAFVGLIAACEHMIFRPGPASVLSLQWGAFLAVAGAALALAAGRIAQPRSAGKSRRPSPPRPTPPRPTRRRPTRRPEAPRTGRHLRPVQ